MKFVLLVHQWKYFTRGRQKTKSIFEKIAIGFFSMIILVAITFTGLSMASILQYDYGKADIVYRFCGLILPYFLFDVVMRFFWQELPTLMVMPYLVQNIRRREIIAFVNICSIFSFLNLLPLLLFLPFIITVIRNLYGNFPSALMAVSILLLCLGNNFLVMLIKRLTVYRARWIFIFSALILVCCVFNYYNIISPTHYSSVLFVAIINLPWAGLTFIFYTLICYYANNRILKKSLYYETPSKSILPATTFISPLFAKFNLHKSTIDISLKSILRNKRPRYFLLLSVVFLFYGIIMFQKKMLDQNQLELPLFGGMIITGLFGISYGQLLFAWDSPYFDALMTYNISSGAFIKEKFRIVILICTVFFLLSTPYGFKDIRLLFILLAIYFFNIGFLPVIAVCFALFNYKRLDLGSNSAFNFQGLGPAQMIYSLVWMLLGAVIYLPFRFFQHAWLGVICLGVAGLTSYVLQKKWINFFALQFIKKKYKILEGFREN